VGFGLSGESDPDARKPNAIYTAALESGATHEKADAALNRGDRIRSLQEILFALNIACAVAFAFPLYLQQNAALEFRSGSFAYYFSRSALKIADLLHGSVSPDVPGAAAHRGRLSMSVQAGRYLVVFISILALTMLLLTLVRFLAGTGAYRWVMKHLAIVTSVLAMPGGYILVVLLSRNWTIRVDETGSAPEPLVAIFAAELFCVAILFIFARSYALSFWVVAGLAFCHYAFWLRILWSVEVNNLIYPAVLSRIVLFAFPASGVAWLLYFRLNRRETVFSQRARRPGKRMLITTGITLVVLLLLWSPLWR
jgi:hypothetical protein